MAVWGGIWGLPNSPICQYSSISKEDMRKLQVLQNKMMRIETGLNYEIPTKELLQSCNYLSVHQMVAYHSSLQIPKIISSQKPQYHTNRITNERNRDTRSSTANLRQIDFKHSLSKSSFFHQATRVWNLIPSNIKSLNKTETLKKQLKLWVSENISIRP